MANHLRKNWPAWRERRQERAKERAEQRRMLADTLTDEALIQHDAEQKAIYDRGHSDA